MTGMIFDIKRFAVHDGDGIRTTVFFKGCPLRCVWCHNPEGLSGKTELSFYAHKCAGCGACAKVCGCHKIADGKHIYDRNACIHCGKCAKVCPEDALRLYGKEVTAAEILPELLSDRDFYENSGGGVTLSGGECLLQAEFCEEFLRALKENGIRTAVDTCGFVPRENIERVLPFTDVFLYDIKAMEPELHKKATGQDNGLILDNLRYLDEKEARVEVRIPYVPDWNKGEMEKIAEFLKTLHCVKKIRILPYHNYAASKYLSLGLADTLPETLPEDNEIREITGKYFKGLPVQES